MRHSSMIASALLSAGLLGVAAFGVLRSRRAARAALNHEQRYRALLAQMQAATTQAQAQTQSALETVARLELALAQSLREQNAVLEHTPVSVCFVKERVIVRCNTGFEKLFGYNKGEPVGQSTRILYASDEEWQQAGAGYLTIAENTYVGDAKFVRKDGTPIWCADHGAALDPNDLSAGTVWTALDVTERKHAEEAIRAAKEAAEEASRMKSEFLANMSHEIRTPMNGVIGMSRLALKTDLDPKQRNYVEKIAVSAENLLGIINGILDFSKVEAGKVVLEKVPFRLDDILDNLSSLIALKTEASGVEVVFRVSGEIPAPLIGDPLRLGQILVNLGSNAAKFTERGEIVIGVDLLALREHSAVLQFSVTDTGIGMTEAQLAKLFQSFSQADGSITRKYGGTGLGLAISKQLVEMMGGTIAVQSHSGSGSRFEFTVELGVGQENGAQLRTAKLSLQERRILVVDDNAVATEVLAETLASFGLEVSTVSSGVAALDALVVASNSGRPIDLVLMDWRMPGWDGIETTRHIRGDARIAATPAILMVTAYSRDDVVAASQGLHLDGFLAKPVNPSLLYDALMDTLYPPFMRTEPAYLPSPSIAPAPGHLTRLAGARVLLVEDNAINREVALEFLAQAPIEVDVAGNGLEAVASVQRTHYDLVLMDIQMPVMDGLQATREIRAMAGFASLPIVALTAHAMVRDQDASREAGMNGHLAKPIDPDDLMRVLLTWIGPQAASRSDTSPPPRSARPAEPLEHKPLPQLAGVDWQVALERINRNPALLYKVIRNFRQDHEQSPQALLTAARDGDLKAIGRIAHGLKSAAAYLGANALSWLASEVEQAVRREANDEALALLPDLVETLAALIQGLAQWGGEPDGLQPGTADPAVLAPIMQRLADLLRRDDARAEDALTELQAALGHTPETSAASTSNQSRLAALRSAVNEIEYRQALEQLQQLAATLGIQPGGFHAQE